MKQVQFKKQSGFTLIELIIVIVILGILAVTAAPRFLDLGSKARAGTLGSLEAAMKSAASIHYAESALDGKPAYPTFQELVGKLDIDDWVIVNDKSAIAAKDGSGAAIEDCHVKYSLKDVVDSNNDLTGEKKIATEIVHKGC